MLTIGSCFVIAGKWSNAAFAASRNEKSSVTQSAITATEKTEQGDAR